MCKFQDTILSILNRIKKTGKQADLGEGQIENENNIKKRRYNTQFQKFKNIEEELFSNDEFI